MTPEQQKAWNELNHAKSNLTKQYEVGDRTGALKWNDPVILELVEKMHDIEKDKPRLTVKIVSSHKDFWYRNMIGTTFVVRECGKNDYSITYTESRIKHPKLDCGCGYICKTDCEVL